MHSSASSRMMFVAVMRWRGSYDSFSMSWRKLALNLASLGAWRHLTLKVRKQKMFVHRVMDMCNVR